MHLYYIIDVREIDKDWKPIRKFIRFEQITSAEEIKPFLKIINAENEKEAFVKLQKDDCMDAVNTQELDLIKQYFREKCQ